MTSKEQIPLTKIIHDDFLTCKICFNTYDNPKLLPCIHTYCSSCMEKLLQTSENRGSISCPECRELVILPNGTVSDLKTNFLINSLIEVLKVKTNKDVECTACNLRGKCSPAKRRCLDCGDYLCSNCSDGHNSSSTTWKHKSVLLEDFKGGSYDKELRNLHKLTCSQHKDKQIEYFCETCQIPICLVCVLFSHRDHKCVTASEAVTAQKQRLISHANNLKGKLDELEIKRTIACEHLAKVKKSETQAIANIEEQIKGILVNIERQKQHALQQVHSCMEEKLNQCTSEVDNMQLKISLATGCLQFCETMIKEGKDEEVLYLENTITKRLQQLEDTPSAEVASLTGEDFPNIDVEQACGIQDLECLLTKQVESSLKEPKSNVNYTFENVKIQQKVSFQLMRTFNTEYDSDKTNPVIKGMTISNETIFLSDSANGKIKCVSTDGDLKECLTTDERFSPFAIAVCNTVIGAVHDNYLFMFYKNGKNTHKILLAAKSNIGDIFKFALANYNNEGFIVGNLPDNNFRVYATNGTLQKRLIIPVCYPLANLSIDQSGHLVTCEWGDNCVRVRTPQGKTMTKCQSSSFWKAIAAHVDTRGFIYAVNSLHATVSVFDVNGNHIYQRATKPDGLLKPVNLAFDKEGLMYLVNSFGNINVYKVIFDDKKV